MKTISIGKLNHSQIIQIENHVKILEKVLSEVQTVAEERNLFGIIEINKRILKDQENNWDTQFTLVPSYEDYKRSHR